MQAAAQQQMPLATSAVWSSVVQPGAPAATQWGAPAATAGGAGFWDDAATAAPQAKPAQQQSQKSSKKNKKNTKSDRSVAISIYKIA